MKHSIQRGFLMILLALSGLLSTTANATDHSLAIGFESYFERSDFLMTSPGAMQSGLYGYSNPALLHYLHQPDVAFHWSSDSFIDEIPRWGGFFGFPGAAFSFVRNDVMDQVYRDYRIAVGGGTDAAAAGLALNWYRGDTDLFDLKTNVTFGTITRPNRYLSIGMTGTTTFNAEYYEAVGDLAIRPTGTPALTLFGDYAVNHQADGFLDGRWSAGAATEALPGIRFTGRYIDDIGFTAGIQFSFGRSGVSYQSHRDNDGNHRYNSYSIRSGALDRNIFDRYFRKDNSYVSMEVRGSLPYQNYQYLDTRQTYLPILDHISEAAADPSVSGIFLNLTSMQIDHAKTWEIRHALETFQQTGKKVVIYIERGGMNTLHLASVADYVMMDPQGRLSIPGYITGMTYLAELMESVGIGVDELREMEYKSAFEVFSRSDMSEADREQRQKIINGFYELVKDDVTLSRGMSGEDYDSLIDRGFSVSARELVAAGIADTLARPSEAGKIIEMVEGREKKSISPADMYVYNKPRDDQWGPVHNIAVLYAEGPTMNTIGIRARVLSAEIRKARKDRSVKAVVLRADSPGGDPLASDLVAEELRRTAEVKPVIVSMGSLAASGGYWISMYADTIVAAPNTITGSIGVATGWLWDDGLGDHLRLNTDYVSRGASADLSFGPTLPLLGLTLPNRSLNETEREQLVDWMNELYDEFIDKVAEGRGVESEKIREVAEGRIWSGADALDIDLVDELGSLYTAIAIAKEKAGLGPNDKVEIVEGPEAQRFSLSMIMGGVFGSSAPEIEKKDPVKEYIEMLIEYNANPLVILPFEYFSWMYYLEQQK